MLRQLFTLPVIAAALVLIVPDAQAARPLITDDARVVDAKSCQMESWVRRERSHTEVWALPGCDFAGGVEFTMGGQAREGDDSPRQVLVQAKTLLKPLEPNGWGAALTMGHVRHSGIHSDRVLRDFYVNAPLSRSLLDDRLVVHGNLGWLREVEKSKKSHDLGFGVRNAIERAGLSHRRSIWPTVARVAVSGGDAFFGDSGSRADRHHLRQQLWELGEHRQRQSGALVLDWPEVFVARFHALSGLVA